MKITFKVGVILEAEQTPANISSVVFYIRRPNSAFDIEQPVGHTGSFFFLYFFFGLIPCAKYVPLQCSCSLACIHWWKCRKSYHLKQNIAALLEGTILHKISEFGQIVAIWRHFWIGIEIMKGAHWCHWTGSIDFIFMPSAELIQEVSHVPLKAKKSHLPTNWYDLIFFIIIWLLMLTNLNWDQFCFHHT